MPEIMSGPYLDRLIVLFMSETMTIWEAFKAGELTVAGQAPGKTPEEDVLAYAEANPDTTQLYRYGVIEYRVYMGFNMLKWPTTELEVRRATAHLIDREYHETTIWKPGITPDSWGYGPGCFGYSNWHNPDVNFKSHYPFSINLAEKELTDNGWKFENDKWIKYFPNGTTREMGTLKFLAPGYSPERVEMGIKLQEDASDIGMNWEIVHPPDWPSTERMAYNEREFNLFVNSATADALNPPHWYWWAYNSESWKPKGTSTINHFGILDPKMDELTNQLKTTNSIDEAISLVWQIQEHSQDMCYVMPATWSWPALDIIRTDEFEYPFGLAELPEMSASDPEGPYQSFYHHLNTRPIDQKFGGTYIENRAYFPTSWNPLNWMEAPEDNIFEYMYLRLANHIRLPDGNDVSIPMLARDWKVETVEVSPGNLGNKMTFHLFNNITWHDGVPVTAEDVKYTLDLIKAIKTPCADYAPVWTIYTKSIVTDPYTIEIYTKEPGIFQFYTIIKMLTLPKHIYEIQPDVNAFDNFPPIGNGPFVFEDMKSHEFISMTANPRYYLPARKLNAEVKLAETEKIVGDTAKFQIGLTGPMEETVTNSTVTLSVQKAGDEILFTTATHIGEGVYEVLIDTAAIGTGDYIIRAKSVYSTPLLTYETPTTIYLTVLPKVYETLVESTEALRQELNSAIETISELETTISEIETTTSIEKISEIETNISELQDTVSGLAGISGTVSTSIMLSAGSIIIAIIAVVLVFRKQSA